MKAHINMEKTNKDLEHRKAIVADAESYLDKLIAEKQMNENKPTQAYLNYNSNPNTGWDSNIPVIQCTTDEEFERRCGDAVHMEEYIDESLFPPYDPSCGKTYNDYIADLAEQAESDMALVQRYGVSGELITEILRRPDDKVWDNNPQSNTAPVLPISSVPTNSPPVPETRENCPFDLDDTPDPDLTEDEGMVSADKLPPEMQRKLCGGDDFINKHYTERKNKETMEFGINSTMFGGATQQQSAPQTTYNNNYMYYQQPMNMMYGGYQNPYMQNPYMYQQPMNMYGQYQNPYIQNPMMPQQNNGVIQFGSMASAVNHGFNYGRPQNTQNAFELKDGVMVRKITPYFSVKPEGNSYAQQFAMVYNYGPEHPSYKEIEALYRKEEYGKINLDISLACFSRPSDISKEDYKAKMRAIYDPYSVEYAVAQNQQAEETRRVNDEIKNHDPFEAMATQRFTCHLQIIDGATGKVIVDGGKIDKEMPFNREIFEQRVREQMFKEFEEVQRQNRIAAFYNAAERRRQELYRRCPDINDVSVEDFFSGKSDLSQRIYDYQVTETEARMKRRNTLGGKFDVDFYEKVGGLLYRYQAINNCTPGEEIIAKCGLKPGDPLFNYYMDLANDHKWRAFHNFNEDGTFKRDKHYEAQKRAYDLALQYPSNNIDPGKPCHNIPPNVLATLPQDVLVELGLAVEPVEPLPEAVGISSGGGDGSC